VPLFLNRRCDWTPGQPQRVHRLEDQRPVRGPAGGVSSLRPASTRESRLAARSGGFEPSRPCQEPRDVPAQGAGPFRQVRRGQGREPGQGAGGVIPLQPVSPHLVSSRRTPPHPTPPQLTSPPPAPHLTSPHITSPHLTSPHLTSSPPHLTSPHLNSPQLTSPHLIDYFPARPGRVEEADKGAGREDQGLRGRVVADRARPCPVM
jgi:hypothetical protein